MINNKRIYYIAGFLLLQISFQIQAQIISKGYPKGYFRDPLDLPINLSGNFGELRPGHFHMGLDIKTLARVNQTVHAAADGYIARVKIEPAGFGRAIYINHPNGFTTLYAHLNDFSPALETYVKKQQYRQEAWRVFLDIPPGLFPVKKGDFIAFSGTTGGSQAPHLHFEIRRTFDDVNLNPLLFGLPLQDNTKPVILRMAMYDRSKSTYEQSPKLIPLKRSANGYATLPPVILSTSRKVSFAITAFDTHTGSTNANGIYEAWLYDNDQLVSGFQMDNISYNQTRYINAHIDFKTRANGGSFLQHLSVLPGYLNSIYTKVKGDGVIDISDGAVHSIKIVVKDAYGNTSELLTAVRFTGAGSTTLPIPGKMFYPLMLDIYENNDCEFYMGENCLYDSVHVKYARTVSSNPALLSAVHSIGASYIPLQDFMVVRIKPLHVVTPDQARHVVMQRFAGSEQDVEKVEWQNDWASAKFRDFGSFQLVLDEQPPVIIPIGFVNGANLGKAGRIAFTIYDNLKVFKNFRAELDGKWLRFTNDKGRTFIYIFDEMCFPGQHTLKISVEDEAGNSATENYQFTR
ncbi:MAG: M23 family metallopeptidase [Chitinophagaceae bacterium]